MVDIIRRFRDSLLLGGAWSSLLFRAKACRLPLSEDGQVAVLFGISFSIIVLFAGGAVDLNRWLSARSSLRLAVDAAVLAGARSLQTSHDASAAVAIATQYYRQNAREVVRVDDNITFSADDSTTAMRAAGQAFVETPFLSLIGIERLALFAGDEAALAEAVTASGVNSRGDVEVALMLDITSSMAGGKLDDLKEAAKDFVDIVVWPDQSEHTSRVALIPYAEAVAVEASNFRRGVVFGGSQRFVFSDRSGKRLWWRLDPTCPTERTGADAFTDAVPSIDKPLGLFYASDATCMPKSGSVTPLSSDTAQLKRAIDRYQAGGGTAGHLGTAWAWYMLSPGWADVVMPSASPGSYELTRQTGSNGQPALRKIAILMSDGDFDREYCNGVDTAVINCDSPNGSSSEQTAIICQNMKASGITIYSIGLQLSAAGGARSAMEQCASDAAKFYSVEDGEGLRQAYRDIAVQIAAVHVSK